MGLVPCLNSFGQAYKALADHSQVVRKNPNGAGERFDNLSHKLPDIAGGACSVVTVNRLSLIDNMATLW